MDAPEEDLDIKLQKISGDLLSDFDKSFVPFLRKNDGSGGTLVRSRVRARETERLISLLDPFQELPQLLDPHLPKWMPILSEAFLEYQQGRHRSRLLSTRSELLMPLPTAICKILYTLCKIRGEKVIVRFLSNEAKYLELLLSALEESERPAATQAPTSGPTPVQWTWEERYVVLLWLSHLMLVPFDLATISSMDVEDDDLPQITAFTWPNGLPGITTRILPLAIKYLASPGKERDAAKFLLVKISMRRDMQQLGLLDGLVQWALSSLRLSEEVAAMTPYHFIGILSFLSGILVSSSDTSDMDKHMSTIYQVVHGISTQDSAATSMLSSALARKTVIKVIRAITISKLRSPEPDMESMELVETTISFLLENLADNDTPVRFAASKALSIITLKLDEDMASQVVEAVIDSLNSNVLWVKNPQDPTAPATKDLSAVNPLEWHGLMLTLSHLLYRRSPPAENLSNIIECLLMGLSFERRNTSGGSIGTNVRDAACFGIWALARRYTTKELLAVPIPTTSLAKAHNSRDPKISILQVIATDLVVAASLDPAGNIRRGSSAALQELVGRHPDTVEKGIWVVQAVDYHAVALRSRALQEVALSATKLSSQYGEAILDALLGWRGVGDFDAASRRAAGASYGTIAAELASESTNPLQQLDHYAGRVLDSIKSLQARQVEERHGLFLSLAAVLNSLPGIFGAQNNSDDQARIVQDLEKFSTRSVKALMGILSDCETKTYRKPELVAEAASKLIVSSFPILQAVALIPRNNLPDSHTGLLSGPELFSKSSVEISSLVDALHPGPEMFQGLAGLVKANLEKWLARANEDLITATSEAALVLLILCGTAEREQVIRQWAGVVQHRPSGRAVSTASGYFSALAISYSVLPTLNLVQEDRDLMCNAILARWTSDQEVDTRVAILKSLTRSDILKQNINRFLDLIADGLDDYTTNARGDVGSLVRLQAIRVTKSLWETMEQMSQDDKLRVASHLFLRILRLAAEKLDRVRVEAQAALALTLDPSHGSMLRKSTFSSRPYFCFLLDLLSQDWLRPDISDSVKADQEKWMDELMAGYVSSADTGNEELVIATRAALCDFCEQSASNTDAVCNALFRNLKSRQGQDRVLVPTLEVIAFLFHVGVFAACGEVNYKSLCLQVQKAGYKTGNIRKIEACIKVYGAIAALSFWSTTPANEGQAAAAAAAVSLPVQVQDRHPGQKADEGSRDARKRLGALMLHPWPRVRSMVVDELWGLGLMLSPTTSSASASSYEVASSPSAAIGNDAEDDHHGAGGGGGFAVEKLKGVDWGKAEKGVVRTLVEEALQLNG